MRASWVVLCCGFPLFSFAQAASQPASQPVAATSPLLLDEAPRVRSEPPPETIPLPSPPLRRDQQAEVPVPRGRSDVYGLAKLQGNFLAFYLNAGAEASLGYCFPSKEGSLLFPAGIGVEASARVGASGSLGGAFSSFAGGDLSVRFFSPLSRGRFGGSARFGLGLEALRLDNQPESSLAIYGVAAKEYYVVLFRHLTLNYGATLLAARSFQPQPRTFSLFPTLNLGLGLVF